MSSSAPATARVGCSYLALPGPLMVAKFISKTHYKTHLSFFELFCPRLSSKFAKSANMIKKNLF
jgi:hypothetical protein